MPKRKALIIWLVLSAVVGLIAFGVYRVIWCYKIVTRPGGMAVLASDDQVWVFVEMKKLVHRPLMVWENPVLEVGRSVEVFILDQDGLHARHSQADCDYFINPNISVVWRSKDTFLLCEGPSKYSPAKAFIWTGDSFLRDDGLFARNSECQQLVGAKFWQWKDLTKDTSISNGWHVLAAWRDWEDTPLPWGNSTCRFNFTGNRKGRIEFHASIGKDGAPHPEIVVELEHRWRPRRMSMFEYSALTKGVP